MALFKIFRGTSENLPAKIHDGYAYFTVDDGKFYIDASDKRILINPNSSHITAQDVVYVDDEVVTNVGAVLDRLLSSSASIQIHTSAQWAQDEYGGVISDKKTLYVYSDGYTLQDGTIVPRLKLGDGLSYIRTLPFLDQAYRQDLLDHINNMDIHTSLEQKLAWWNKLNVDDDREVVNGILIFNRN